MFHPCSGTLVVLSFLMSRVSTQPESSPKASISSQSALNCEIINDQVKLGVNDSCYIDLRSNRATVYLAQDSS